jgi:hypothetical protein
LKDAEQAARHEASWAGYYHAQQQLDLFLLRYSNVDSTPETREEALKKLEQITNDIDTVNSNSITLTERAWKAARKLGH